MSKNLLQDIVAVKKRDKILTPNVLMPKPKKNKRYKLYLIALLSIIFLFFAISFFLATAKIAVNPENQDMPLNQNLSAAKDSSAGGLAFTLMAIDGEEDMNVQGGAVKAINADAQGEIFIYNAYSASFQTLAKGTQLSGSNGKIYKTIGKAIIPGISKNGTPGKIEVGISASAAGEEYNSAPLDFSIVSFKGTPKYSLIYGRSDGNITGGLKGEYYQITAAQKKSTLTELTAMLQAKLLAQAAQQIPSGLILFPNAAFLDADTDDVVTTAPAGQSSGMVPVKLTGTLYGFLFNEQALTVQIAKETVGQTDSTLVNIPNLRALTFSLINKDNASFNDVQNINFNLSGTANVVWNVDTAQLMADLLGRSKKDLTEVLSEYPHIVSANVTISPFWVMSFPDKAKNMTITVSKPQ